MKKHVIFLFACAMITNIGYATINEKDSLLLEILRRIVGNTNKVCEQPIQVNYALLIPDKLDAQIIIEGTTRNGIDNKNHINDVNVRDDLKDTINKSLPDIVNNKKPSSKQLKITHGPYILRTDKEAHWNDTAPTIVKVYSEIDFSNFLLSQETQETFKKIKNETIRISPCTTCSLFDLDRKAAVCITNVPVDYVSTILKHRAKQIRKEKHELEKQQIEKD